MKNWLNPQKDLHASQLQGFFNVPVGMKPVLLKCYGLFSNSPTEDNLYAEPTALRYIRYAISVSYIISCAKYDSK